MTFPEERIADVCKLGPVEGSHLLDRGRAGDTVALASWVVWSAYRHIIKQGASPSESVHHLRIILREVDIQPRLV